jgi:hypothetical protein
MRYRIKWENSYIHSLIFHTTKYSAFPLYSSTGTVPFTKALELFRAGEEIKVDIGVGNTPVLRKVVSIEPLLHEKVEFGKITRYYNKDDEPVCENEDGACMFLVEKEDGSKVCNLPDAEQTKDLKPLKNCPVWKLWK